MAVDVGRTGHATPKVYWVSDVERELRLSSPGEYAEAFREVLTEAVRCRLRSDRPIGSALSGGLDSSSIACLARDLLPPAQQPVHTFSAVFTGLPEEERRRSDESPWIDSVLSTGGFEPHRVQADRLGPLFELPRLLRHYDEPSLGYNGYMSRALYAAAREAGVGV